MRPLRIELDGFSAFRSHTVVDFDGVDLFAFVGPTGAGKSSVIDGMIFALYGSVPRYDSTNLVHPVITQGKPEARVRLDFEADGQCYTAVRVVRRTKTGASTREARLERGDEVLAADVSSMNAAVVALLGLELDQFTKCVVLPQGAFAALLHETRKQRQELLVKLLDLGVYGDVAVAARRQINAADVRLAVLDEQLASLAHATDHAVAEATARRTAIDAVVAEASQVEEQLDTLDETLRCIDKDLAGMAADVASLAAITVPDGVAAIAERVRTSAAAALAAGQQETLTADAAEAAEAAVTALGDPAELQRLAEAHERVAVLTTRLADGATKIEAQEVVVADVGVRRDAARQRAETAEAALHAARIENAAAEMARHLHVGDDCPVCGNAVSELRHAAPDLDDIDRARQEAVTALATVEADLVAAERGRDTLTALRDQLAAERDQLIAALGDAPDAETVEARRLAIAEAATARDAARADDRAARAAATDARRLADDARAEEQTARASLTATRDRVAALGPPPTGSDLADDWAALATWAASACDQLATTAAELTDRRERTAATRAELASALLERARAAGIDLAATDRVRDECVRATAAAATTLDRLVEDRERATSAKAERDEVADRRRVHELLAKTLRPDAFQKWMLGEALTALVAGASERLEELSSGRYALTLADDEFSVIDHANADEQRMARTLSGGETFLASLALALALAERVSDLSANARSSLDAIFLDEGFGTLDAETLDVVATAIEELGASGRMVGIVSHVRDLADRVPVRFEVSRGPETSTVERVEL